jgi:hypothetical protein
MFLVILKPLSSFSLSIHHIKQAQRDFGHEISAHTGNDVDRMITISTKGSVGYNNLLCNSNRLEIITDCGLRYRLNGDSVHELLKNVVIERARDKMQSPFDSPKSTFSCGLPNLPSSCDPISYAKTVI